MRLFIKNRLPWVGMLGMVLAIAACQTTPQAPAEDASSASPTPQTVAVDPAQPTTAGLVYLSEAGNFQFAYPEGFVVQTGQASGDIVDQIDLWTEAEGAQIMGGTYQGDEPPANVMVTVYEKPPEQSLTDWISQSDRFIAMGETSPISVGGQDGVMFASEGLYSLENVVVSSPDQTKILVITLAWFGSDQPSPEKNPEYQPAYQELLATLTFLP